MYQNLYLAITKPATVSVPTKLTRWAAPPIDADYVGNGNKQQNLHISP